MTISKDLALDFIEEMAKTAFIYFGNTTAELPNRITKEKAKDEIVEWFKQTLSKSCLTDAVSEAYSEETWESLIDKYESLGLFEDEGDRILKAEVFDHFNFGPIKAVQAEGSYSMEIAGLNFGLTRTKASYDNLTTYCFTSQFF